MNLYLITRNDAVGWDEYDGGETVEQVCWCSRGLKARWISGASREPEYADIAEKRIADAQMQPRLI